MSLVESYGRSALRRAGTLAVVAVLGVAVPAAAPAQSSTVTGVGATIEVNFTSGWTQDRADTAEDAARYWADRISSSVDITIDISFSTLFCTNTSGTLGSAGANGVLRDFANAPLSNTWYPVALANALAGRDLNGSSTAEIRATFNDALDDPARETDCLNGADWHYGTTPAPAGTISFYDVVLHEIAHGLGVFSAANMSTGALLDGRDDVYTRLLEDNSLGLALDDASATDAERQTAATDDGDLVWTGAEVTAATGFLTAGTIGSEALMYAPTTFRSGSSVSHFDTTLTPNELMEPSYASSPRSDLSEALLIDIGWEAANETPVITGQDPLSTSEDVPIEITLDDLTVTDGDNVYPDDFTLAVQAGANFTVNGSTVTPALNFNGTLTATVTVNDGIDDSEPFPVTITVNPVNDPPVITAQSVLSTTEDTPITLSLADFTVTDPDDTSGFTLAVQSDANYSVSGLQVTPDLDFNGTLSVPVTVSDGTDVSAAFDAEVTVIAVNDAPVISGQTSLSTPEDTALALELADLTVTDPDDTYPDDFTLSVQPGTDYTVAGTTITPAAEFSGALTVPVTVNDGDADSTSFDLAVTVIPVNDPPVITAQSALSTTEDTPLALSASDVTIADPDSSTFSLVLEAGPNYTFAGTTITPAPDFNGPLSVRVRANDGTTSGPVVALAVTVTPVNDPPEITSQAASLSTPEDTPLALSLSDVVISDPDDSTFTLRVAPGAGYTVAGTTITPDADFDGTLRVPVTVNDGAADSDVFELTVTVTPVNDAPVITAAAALTTDEDTPIAVALRDLNVDDPDDTFPADFTIRATPGADYSVTGDATIEPAANFEGTLQVDVTVNDGEADSAPFTVTITVRGVNDPPVITSQSAIVIDEDTTRTLRPDDFAIEDPDDAQPTFRVLAGAGYSVSGADVTPDPNFSGTLTVGVVPTDGTDDGPEFPLEIEVRPINDPPRVEAQAPIVIDEDASVTLSIADFTVIDPDDDASALALTVRPGVAYTVAGTTVTPDPDFAGTLAVEVVPRDDTDDGPPFDATIEVRPVNDPPVVTGQSPVTAIEAVARRITPADLVILDPDDDAFVVRLQPGVGYTAADDVLTPDAGSRGVLEVPVIASDGDADSEPFPLRVSVAEARLESIVEADATGLFTPRPALTPPEALGILDGPVTVELERAPDFFRPGAHLVTWKETDAAGNEAFRDQRVWIHPRVALAPGPELAEGTSGELRVQLNGRAPRYPLQIAYSVGGSATSDDHDLESGIVRLEDGETSIGIPIEVFADGANDDGEVVEVRLNIARNIAVESARIILRDENVLPFVTLEASQADATRTQFVAGAGPAQLTASIVDEAVPGVRWSFPGGEVTEAEGPAPQWIADAATLGALVAEVVDDAGATARRSLLVRWVEAPPQLSSGDDLDGDGIDDAAEGAGDEDLDALADYADYWRLPHVAALGETAGGPRAAGRVVEATAGVRLSRGRVAVRADASGVRVTRDELRAAGISADDSARYAEVSATELPRGGAVVAFAMPLTRPLGGGETVRVRSTDGWFDFLEDDDDRLASAPSADGFCPPPDADEWRRPVRAGDTCVRLSVEDGDVNDADGEADRQIRLLAALAPRAITDVGPGADAGPVAPDSSTGGAGQIAVKDDCSCRATSGSSSAFAGLALLALVGALRLRTRRSLSLSPTRAPNRDR